MGVPPHVEDLTLVVDGRPQIHPLTGDPHHRLVEVPAIARGGASGIIWARRIAVENRRWISDAPGSTHRRSGTAGVTSLICYGAREGRKV